MRTSASESAEHTLAIVRGFRLRLTFECSDSSTTRGIIITATTIWVDSRQDCARGGTDTSRPEPT